MENNTCNATSSPQKEEVGSLLKMFKSEYFTQDLHLYYLHKYFSSNGISDFLIN